MKKQRDNNIEVLRCAMMFVIVLGHMAGMGRYAGDKMVHAIFTLVYFATSAFVFISGWYGIRFAWSKVWKLLGVGLFASAVNSALSKFALGYWDWNFSLGWFGNSYLALLLLTPLINAGIQALVDISKTTLYTAWTAAAIACVLSWCHLGGHISIAPAGWIGNSTLALFFVYFTGRVVSYSDWVKKVTVKTALLWVFALSAVNIVWSWLAMMGHSCPLMAELFIGTRGGNSPLTIAIALWVFLLFKSIRFPKRLATGCALMAPSMLSVYLLHLGSFEAVSKACWSVNAFVDASSSVGKVGATFLATLIVFSCCLIVDVVRRVLLCNVNKICEERGCYAK